MPQTSGLAPGKLRVQAHLIVCRGRTAIDDSLKSSYLVNLLRLSREHGNVRADNSAEIDRLQSLIPPLNLLDFRQ